MGPSRRTRRSVPSAPLPFALDERNASDSFCLLDRVLRSKM